jgi:hypothetical protein
MSRKLPWRKGALLMMSVGTALGLGSGCGLQMLQRILVDAFI